MFEPRNSTESTATVRSTIDAGEQWVNGDFLTYQNNVYIHDVNFLNSSTGWIAGGLGNAWCSCNGGAQWSKIETGEASDFYGVDFVGTSQGWLAGGSIVHTEDAGRTWTTQYRSPVSHPLQDVDFVDSLTGWAVGISGILHTNDGGHTWTPQGVTKTAYLYDVEFVSAAEGWAVGGYQGGAVGEILHTSDGGQNWASQSPGSIGLLNAVEFENSSVGWAVGGSGTILKTTDGGLSWVAQVSGTNQNLNDIVMAVAPPFDSADFNQDRRVNDADFSIWIDGFGDTEQAGNSQGDADGDADVDGTDFLLWQQQFTMTCPSVAPSVSVPEPATLALTVWVLAGVASQRDRSLIWRAENRDTQNRVVCD